MEEAVHIKRILNTDTIEGYRINEEEFHSNDNFIYGLIHDSLE